MIVSFFGKGFSMEKTENKVPGISGNSTSVLARIDAFRAQTNRSRISRPRAVSMVEKYAVDIRSLHAAGRPQEDVLLPSGRRSSVASQKLLIANLPDSAVRLFS